MTLKEIAAIAMDEADEMETSLDAVAEELEVAEDRSRAISNRGVPLHNLKPSNPQPIKGPSTAPKNANAPKPSDPTKVAGGNGGGMSAEARHAQLYPGSFGKLDCKSKNKDGCVSCKTGIFADPGSKFAKFDASGKQVYATEEQRKNAKPDDEADQIAEVPKPQEGEGKENPAPAASPDAPNEVSLLQQQADAAEDPAKKEEIEKKIDEKKAAVVQNLAPAEQKNVGALDALAKTGYGDKVIDAMEGVVKNERATENDKIAAAMTAMTAINALKKDVAAGKATQEQVEAAQKKVDEITKAAEKPSEEKPSEVAKTSESKTLKVAPSKEEQAKMAAAIKNSFGGLYNDFMKDVEALADGQCFAAGDDEGEDHYFVKKDGKIYRADANDQPTGEALTADEVMCAMIGEGHLWSDGKRTAGAVPETGVAPSAQQVSTPSAPTAEAPAPAPAAAPAQPVVPTSMEDMTRMIGEAESKMKEAAKAKAQQDMAAEWQKALSETDPQKQLAAMKAVQSKFAAALAAIDNPSAPAEPLPVAPATPAPTQPAAPAEASTPTQPAQPEAGTGSTAKPVEPVQSGAPVPEQSVVQPATNPSADAPKAESPAPDATPENQAGNETKVNPEENTASAEESSSTSENGPATQAQIDEAKQNDPEFEGSVAHLSSDNVPVGAPVSFTDADGNPDSGLNKMVKASDGKFYHVDADGEPTGQGFTAEQAYLEMKNKHDPVPEGQSIEEHMKHCRAKPQSNCPFLRQHMAEMTPAQQHEVFGGEEPKSDGQPVAAPSLKSLVDSGTLDAGRARTIETGLTSENTGLGDDDLDALRETAAAALADRGAESINKAMARLASMAKSGSVDASDPESRAEAVQKAIQTAFWDKDAIEAEDKLNAFVARIKQTTGHPPSAERIARFREMMKNATPQQQADTTDLGEAVALGTQPDLMSDMVAKMVSELEHSNLSKDEKANLQQYAQDYAKAKTGARKIALKDKIAELHGKYIPYLGDDDDALHTEGEPSSVGVYDSGTVTWEPDHSELGTNRVEGQLGWADSAIEKTAKWLNTLGISINPTDAADSMTSTDKVTTINLKLPDVYTKAIKGQKYQMLVDGNKISQIEKNLPVAIGGNATVKVTQRNGDENKYLTITIPNSQLGHSDFGALLESQEWKDAKAKGPGSFCLGTNQKDGKAVITNLTDATHLLVAGMTNMGKTQIGYNAGASLCAGASPDELTLHVMDPKGTDLGRLGAYPHCKDVFKTGGEMVKQLQWCINEMNNREKLFEKAKQAGVNISSIAEYNKAAKEGRLPKGFPPSLKYDVTMIDELANLMTTHGKEVEPLLRQILQKARSYGIHVMAFTQRPDTKTLPGDMKNNFPSVLGLGVKDASSNRVVMEGENLRNLTPGQYKLQIRRGETISGTGSFFADTNRLDRDGKKQTEQWEKFKKDHPATSDYAKHYAEVIGRAQNEAKQAKAAARFTIEGQEPEPATA